MVLPQLSVSVLACNLTGYMQLPSLSIEDEVLDFDRQGRGDPLGVAGTSGGFCNNTPLRRGCEKI